MSGLYETTDEFYRDIRELRQLKSFSMEWHRSYAAIAAKVPYPARHFGVDNDVDMAGLQKMALPNKEVETVPAVVAADGASEAVGRVQNTCKKCKGEVAIVPQPRLCHSCTVAAASADAKVETWLHEGTVPAVYRCRPEYIARMAFLEDNMKRWERQKGLEQENQRLKKELDALRMAHGAVIKQLDGQLFEVQPSESAGRLANSNVVTRNGGRKRSKRRAEDAAEEDFLLQDDNDDPDESGPDSEMQADGVRSRSSSRKRTPSLQMLEALANHVEHRNIKSFGAS